MNLPTQKPTLTAKGVSKPGRSHYILKLDGPLNTAVKIQEATGLNKLPMILTGDASYGDASLVRGESFAKEAIEQWLSKEQSNVQPTLARILKANKELSRDSKYPVWYFCYGISGDPNILTSLLSLSEPPAMRSASTTGGIIKSWAGKYKANRQSRIHFHQWMRVLGHLQGS